MSQDPETLALRQARAADANRARHGLDAPDEPGLDDDLPLELAGHEVDEVALEPLPDASSPDPSDVGSAAPPSLGFDLERLDEDAPTEIEGDSTADATESIGDRQVPQEL